MKARKKIEISMQNNIENKWKINKNLKNLKYEQGEIRLFQMVSNLTKHANIMFQNNFLKELFNFNYKEILISIARVAKFRIMTKILIFIGNL